MADLKLFNVGWNCRAKRENTAPFGTTYNQIGNELVFAESAVQAYDMVAEKLNNWHKKDLDWINNFILFVEPVDIKLGVIKYRDAGWSDLSARGALKRDDVL